MFTDNKEPLVPKECNPTDELDELTKILTEQISKEINKLIFKRIIKKQKYGRKNKKDRFKRSYG